MTHHLSVQFNGITPLVPLESDSKWLAVLPDISRVHGPWKPRIEHTIAPHVACVIVADDAVDPLASDKRPCLIFLSKKFGGRRHRLYTFEQESLTVATVPAGQRKLSVQDDSYHSPVPKNTSEAHSLHWVAPLDSMGLKGAGLFNKDLLVSDRPNPNWANVTRTPPLGLAGTVILDHGSLSLDGVATDLIKSKPILFEFKRGIGGGVVHEQAQVDHIILTDQNAPDCVLEFRGPNAQYRQVGLRPIGGRFEVSIFNLELETILDVGSGTGPGDGSDPDFVVSYLLSKNWHQLSPQNQLPYPFPTGTAIGGSRLDCNPARFSGV